MSEHFLLVIDELNRGNAAAILGNVFQLLDRESDGWSSYEVNISDMELYGLLQEMRLPALIQEGNIVIKPNPTQVSTVSIEDYFKGEAARLKSITSGGERVCNTLKEHRISIPNNLSIVATINTSDESIYYLDSAFKRRWDWEYVDSPSGNSSTVPSELRDIKLVSGNQDKELWQNYVIGINKALLGLRGLMYNETQI
jgi:5-methylcytosine-specific restriction protein B